MWLEPLFDLPPVEGNPRNSEGAFLSLQDGRSIFLYRRFSDGIQDDAKADIWSLTLSDKYAQMQHELVLRAEDEGCKNLMSISLLRMQNDDIGLFYLRREGETGLRLYLRRSSDEGKSWSNPLCTMPRQGFFVVNNDRVTRLADGRIIIPAAEHKKMRRDDGSIFFDSRAEAVFFFSDDDGLSFAELPGKGVMPFPCVSSSGLQEPGVLERHSGVLWSYARTDLGRQNEMFSFNRGQSWTPVSPSPFISPLSPLSAKRLRDGRILVLYNPIPNYDNDSFTKEQTWTGGRSPLIARVSPDDGATFSKPFLLENQPGHGYCYVAIHEDSRGEVLLAYCAGGPGDGSCLARLRIARLHLD